MKMPIKEKQNKRKTNRECIFGALGRMEKLKHKYKKKYI